jgi:hypothetical protein
MSAFGTKQTWASAPHMSAFDPKRTLCAALSATGTKKQLIGSLQQNGDAARPELVWQLVEMNDKDWDAWGEAAQDASMGPAQRTASHSGVQGQC